MLLVATAALDYAPIARLVDGYPPLRREPVVRTAFALFGVIFLAAGFGALA